MFLLRTMGVNQRAGSRLGAPIPAGAQQKGPHKAVIECLVGIAPRDRGVGGAEGALLLQRRWSSLVLFHRRIDLFRPSQNAAGKV